MIQTLIILIQLMVPPHFGGIDTLSGNGGLMECSKDEDCPQIECYRTFCVEQKCYMTESCV